MGVGGHSLRRRQPFAATHAGHHSSHRGTGAPSLAPVARLRMSLTLTSWLVETKTAGQEGETRVSQPQQYASQGSPASSTRTLTIIEEGLISPRRQVPNLQATDKLVSSKRRGGTHRRQGARRRQLPANRLVAGPPQHTQVRLRQLNKAAAAQVGRAGGRPKVALAQRLLLAISAEGINAFGSEVIPLASRRALEANVPRPSR